MRDLSDESVPAVVPRHKYHTGQDNQENVRPVNSAVHNKPSEVPGGISLLEDLRSNHITNSPPYKDHCHGNSFLGLARNVPRNKRDNHVALGKEELCTIESDEHPPGIT